MKVCFFYADKEREEVLADAFLSGVRALGDVGVKVQKTSPKGGIVDADVYCMVGVKSLKLFHEVRGLGKHVIYFDKGYFRHRGPNRTWEYWRVAVNTHHPTDYLMVAEHSGKRWRRMAKARSVAPLPWRTAGGHVLYAGSSAKYHTFCGLPGPTEYAEWAVAELRKVTDRPIIYRPKPTWSDAVPVRGASFSPPEQAISTVLTGAWCVVTHGSNACFDAVMAGVPSVVLGNGIAKPISSTSLDEVNDPRLATMEERYQWLHNVAWCMFTEIEMSRGLAWATLRPQLSGESVNEHDIPASMFLTTPLKKATKAEKKKRVANDERSAE